MSRLLTALNPIGLVVLAATVAAWQVAVVSGLLDFDYLPAPSEVANGIGELAESGELSAAFIHTARNVLIAWALAMVVGIALGVAIGLVDRLWSWMMASIEMLRTVPVVALVPVALLVFGPESTAEIVVAAYAASWPVLINATGGIRSVKPQLHEVAATFRLSRWATIRKVVLPAALPTIVVGARLGLAISLVIVVVAEMIGPPEGLGYGLVEQQLALQPARMWAYVIVIGILGLLLNGLLNAIAGRQLRRFGTSYDRGSA